MLKNVASQVVCFAGIVRTDGTDGTGVTPAITVAKDGAAPAAGTGTVSEVAAGCFEYLPTQAETNADHVVFIMKQATLITQVVNVYPISPDLYKANVAALALASELALVPKTGTEYRYTNGGSGAGFDDVTITVAP